MEKKVKLGKSPLGDIVELSIREDIIVYSIENKEKELEFRNMLYTQLLQGEDVQLYEYNQTDGYSWEELKSSQIHLREKHQLLHDKDLYTGKGNKVIHVKDSEGIESVISQYVQEIKRGVFESTSILIRVKGDLGKYLDIIDLIGRDELTAIIYSGEKGFSAGLKLFKIPIPINEGDSEIIVKGKWDLIPKRVQMYKIIDGDKDLPLKRLEFEV